MRGSRSILTRIRSFQARGSRVGGFECDSSGPPGGPLHTLNVSGVQAAIFESGILIRFRLEPAMTQYPIRHDFWDVSASLPELNGGFNPVTLVTTPG